MTGPLDKTEFVDRDLEAGPAVAVAATAPPPTETAPASRPPTREELEAKVGEAQQQLGELKRRQAELERERAVCEEGRRRQQEFETGRVEMQQHLTRGIGLLEKAELDARRQAEQMTKTLAAFREALARVNAIKETAWTRENWTTELTQALTTIENARMEWNGARLKWPVLEGDTGPAQPTPEPGLTGKLHGLEFGRLARAGLALTWPLAVALLLAFGALLVVLLRR